MFKAFNAQQSHALYDEQNETIVRSNEFFHALYSQQLWMFILSVMNWSSFLNELKLIPELLCTT